MWSVQTQRLDGRTVKVRALWHGAPLASSAAYELCVSSEAFRAALIDELARAPFAAYFWETPPTTIATSTRPFEYVVTDAPGLASAASETEAFREHFSKDDDADGVVTFRNLGGDATLVVPCPLAELAVYAHVAAFVRDAHESQRHALFRAIGAAAVASSSERPQWISTAGMGVYWLHVRLDSRPKYYRHAPYKETETVER